MSDMRLVSAALTVASQHAATTGRGGDYMKSVLETLSGSKVDQTPPLMQQAIKGLSQVLDARAAPVVNPSAAPIIVPDIRAKGTPVYGSTGFDPKLTK